MSKSEIRYCTNCKEWVETRQSAGGKLYEVSMMDLHICPKCDYATDLMEQPIATTEATRSVTTRFVERGELPPLPYPPEAGQ